MSGSRVKRCQSITWWGSCIWKWALQAVSLCSAGCVLQHFLNSVFPVTLMHARLPHMGMPAHAHGAVPVPSPTMLRHRCTLLSASWITVCTSFEMAPIKCFFFVCLFFAKEGSTRQNLRAFLFLVKLFTSSRSTWAELMAELLLKDRV